MWDSTLKRHLEKKLFYSKYLYEKIRRDNLQARDLIYVVRKRIKDYKPPARDKIRMREYYKNFVVSKNTRTNPKSLNKQQIRHINHQNFYI